MFGDVDAVAVSLPPDVQAGIAEAAARAGRHLLLEKPLTLDVSAADRVAGAVADTGVASVVLFTGRLVPEIADWVEASRGLGWTGGHVIWLGTHALSMPLPLPGSVATGPEGVTASRGPGDTVHVAMRHDSGASSVLTLSFSVPAAAARSEVAVWGEPGWSRMPDLACDARSALGRGVDDLVAQVGDTGRSEHPCGVEFAREVVAVLDRTQQALPSSPRMASTRKQHPS